MKHLGRNKLEFLMPLALKPPATYLELLPQSAQLALAVARAVHRMPKPKGQRIPSMDKCRPNFPKVCR